MKKHFAIALLATILASCSAADADAPKSIPLHSIHFSEKIIANQRLIGSIDNGDTLLYSDREKVYFRSWNSLGEARPPIRASFVAAGQSPDKKSLFAVNRKGDHVIYNIIDEKLINLGSDMPWKESIVNDRLYILWNTESRVSVIQVSDSAGEFDTQPVGHSIDLDNLRWTRLTSTEISDTFSQLGKGYAYLIGRVKVPGDFKGNRVHLWLGERSGGFFGVSIALLAMHNIVFDPQGRYVAFEDASNTTTDARSFQNRYFELSTLKTRVLTFTRGPSRTTGFAFDPDEELKTKIDYALSQGGQVYGQFHPAKRNPLNGKIIGWEPSTLGWARIGVEQGRYIAWVFLCSPEIAIPDETLLGAFSAMYFKDNAGGTVMDMAHAQGYALRKL